MNPSTDLQIQNGAWPRRVPDAKQGMTIIDYFVSIVVFFYFILFYLSQMLEDFVVPSSITFIPLEIFHNPITSNVGKLNNA